MDYVYVDARQLPTGESCDLCPTEIALPTPEDVLSRAKRDGIDTSRTFRPEPVCFSELDLIVKWGQDVTIAEGQCLWVLRQHFKEQVPVPIIYGWRKQDGLTFLYMQLIHGHSMETLWDELAEDDRLTVCKQLRSMIQAWRRLKPAPIDSGPLWRLFSAVMNMCGMGFACRPRSESRLCAINGEALRDIMFQDAGKYPAGPFQNTREFHDAFAGLLARGATQVHQADRRRRYPELAGLTDDVPVTFAHADLDLSNILLSNPQDGAVRVLAIIDWHQAGWYPKPWQRLKASSVAMPGTDWTSKYLDLALNPAPFKYFYAFEYISMSTI